LIYTLITPKLRGMSLTPKQRSVFEFICKELDSTGISPTYDEIRREFQLASYNSVQKYLKQLEKKGFIKTGESSQKRAIQVVEKKKKTLPEYQNQSESRGVSLPFLGKVAAGNPLEAIATAETIEVPAHLISRGEHFVLRVQGDSMIEEGILDGDYAIIRRQDTAVNGDPVVASYLNEVTLKRFFKKPKAIELRPSHPTMKPIQISQSSLDQEETREDFRILGVLVGLFRKY